mmetsp:Transcript_19914/g.32770  ORF Transcript_19914/g.32770 Transcript_19914/m.32770 type:complete len:581 (-) Transcript_19914:48-1790(-)|eukprot:CAMPEP_0203754738 /NCGR_PEP_ID=MMETSP0098-20131031/8297_1 /ASSEMBLY_ACC=CAM_ASM_000208 /TAXON_ID=96639 /ORGANISM=" , Strain NY0313808BC1" /LENGTH=580 /DNA_ID=CAMNT_0050645909 /DNA_START=103 /DNA_END=1845 /DNA_ORIENTATION=+
MDGPPGDGAGDLGQVPVPEEVQMRIRILENLVQQLQSQLEKIRVDEGDAGEKWTLEQVQEKLQQACERLMNGDESAQEEFDKWDRVLNEHPEKLALDAKAEAEWDEKQTPLNAAALDICHQFLPPDIREISKDVLIERGVSSIIAERIFKKKGLWLTRMDSTFISKMHIADLNTKFSPHKLDLIELRAVYHVLPTSFENDKGGAKQQWRDSIRAKLKAAIKNMETSSAEDVRSIAYYNAVTFESIAGVFGHVDSTSEAFKSLRDVICATGIAHKVSFEKRKTRPPKQVTKTSGSVRKLDFSNKLAAALGAGRGRGGKVSAGKIQQPPTGDGPMRKTKISERKNVPALVNCKPKECSTSDEDVFESARIEGRRGNFGAISCKDIKETANPRRSLTSALVERFETPTQHPSEHIAQQRAAEFKVEAARDGAAIGNVASNKSFKQTLERALSTNRGDVVESEADDAPGELATFNSKYSSTNSPPQDMISSWVNLADSVDDGGDREGILMGTVKVLKMQITQLREQPASANASTTDSDKQAFSLDFKTLYAFVVNQLASSPKSATSPNKSVRESDVEGWTMLSY